jgi:hypothetical protein
MARKEKNHQKELRINRKESPEGLFFYGLQAKIL